jgi:penicillin-insensitive murein endopeptidase
MIRTFASDPRVERIFVNPSIKRLLCATATGDRGWLTKVRPWWGHADHFHVRTVCPAGDHECIAGPPIPAGDGCGAGLDWWFGPEANQPPAKAPNPPAMPAACKKILAVP